MSQNLKKGINNMYVKAMKTSHHHQLFGPDKDNVIAITQHFCI